MGNQVEQWPQLVLNRLKHALVQVACLVALRYVQQTAELVYGNLPHACLPILLQAAIALLRIAGLQGRELGQLEARELRREVVEQEREARIDLNQ